MARKLKKENEMKRMAMVFLVGMLVAIPAAGDDLISPPLPKVEAKGSAPAAVATRERNEELDGIVLEAGGAMRAVGMIHTLVDGTGFELVTRPLSESEKRVIGRVGRLAPRNGDVFLIGVNAEEALDAASGRDGEPIPDLELEVEFLGIAHEGEEIRLFSYRTRGGIPMMRGGGGSEDE